MPIHISPIQTRKRKRSSRNRTYTNMHKRRRISAPAFNLNAYRKMHERAFPTAPAFNLNAYKKMHERAFPTKKSGSRS